MIRACRITGMANSGCFPVKFPELQDHAWLHEHYVAQEQSLYKIARTIGCSVPHASSALKRAGISARPHTQWRIDADGRECASCGHYQLWSQFYRGSKKAPHGRMPRCKTCEKNKPKYQARSTLLSKFGITPEEYLWLSEQQGDVCALCLHPESRSDSRWAETVWSLAVDHDHEHCLANRACKFCIRGLLCASCNTMLGRVEQAGPPLTLRFSDYLASRPLLREGVMPMNPSSGDLMSTESAI
jgi:hypothetical protein